MNRIVFLRSILLFGLLSGFSYLKGNPYDVSRMYEYIDISNGLPQNTVRCFEKDNFGFIWIGTDYGLCRYDGYDFEYYNASNNSLSLNDNRIVDILADSRGLIWIVTQSGVQILNSTTDKFIDVSNSDVREILSKDIVQVVEANSHIWIATLNEGIYDLEVKKGSAEIIVHSHYGLGTNEGAVSCITYGEDDHIYVGTNKDVYMFNHEIGGFEKIQLDIRISFDVYVLYQDDDCLWIGTTNGLFRYYPKTKQLDWYAHNSSDKNTIAHSNVTSLIKDATGKLLVGTLGGLCVYNSETNDFSQIRLFSSVNGGPNYVFVSELFADKEGNVWIGTEKTGVVHSNVFSKKFYSFKEDDQYKPFNYNIINSIHVSDIEIWVGTAGDGLYWYNRIDQSVKHLKFGPGSSGGLTSDFISAFIEDQKGNKWIGAWGTGIQKLNIEDGKNIFRSYLHAQGLPSTFISCFYIGSRGELIVGTNSGLAVYDEKNNLFVPVGITNEYNAWKVGCIHEDNKGFLWVGTTDGLYRFKADLISPDRSEELSKYDVVTFKKTAQKGSLPNDYITCIDEDSNGNVWVGTYGNGIAKCVANEDGSIVFENYTEEDGLTNNVVYKVLVDANDDLWISTENGLSHYKVKDSLFVNYYKKDGLRNDQYYWSAGCKDDSGNLYFGGLSGLNFFNPDSIIDYPSGSKTFITKLNVVNDVVRAGEKRQGIIPLTKSVFSADTIHLSYKDNVFSFEFSALPYFLSSKIKYEYQLEGVDQNWVEVGSDRRIASYTNLNGGEYLFKVRSTNIDGVWNKNYSSVLLIIDPPYWRTSWFKIVLLLALVLLAVVYVRYRSIRITVQKRRLERIVEERTDEIKVKNEQLEHNSEMLIARNEQLAQRQEEIEKQKNLLEKQNKEIISQRDQLIELNEEVESIHQSRMQFFTNISHEFRTPLTLIISPIEKMLNDSFSFSKENVKHTISYVKRNAERLLMLTNEILTFRKFEAGKIKISLSQGNLSELIQNIADAFKILTEQKSIVFNIAIDFNLENVWFDKEKLENILSNLLSNAIKYTPEKGKVSLAATRMYDSAKKPYVLINIQDNGIGISENAQAKVFDRFFRDDSDQQNSSYGTGIGLSLTKQMVEIQNGKISLESEINKGSSFKVMLPLEKEDFPVHDILATEVEEQIPLQKRVMLMTDIHLDAVSQESSKQNAEKGKTNILIVEDNSDLREFLAEALAVNYNVSTAENGEVGYQVACENDFDLIVSDIMMPKVDGLELCKMLKNNLQTSHVPIVLLTAKNQEEDFVEGFKYGADDYVSKPFNLTVLQAKIDSIIANRKKLLERFQKPEEVESEPEAVSMSLLDEEFMGKVNQVIEESYTDSTFDIDTFSSKLYVSRSLLYKKLKALTDVSPNEYITIYRLKKSIALLKSKKHQVSEVAFMVGFNDPKYFSRVFKKYYDCSPSAYVE
ncbi:hybrid sensor histidine kinase/response regulator transcription factor [Plebeiibacterium sediminum]|uniref:histidine kinase n=1 Tax=Plebeiibacterium sediminum TaxID=2992112 RepID=A0AAE3M4Q8_9BACT|nr:two-component regulator propeller domain-containing protein [Plebeiobacterium sediminum]MCW3786807.1 response regulator [Plebeiobacterium sediminum]